MQQFPLVWKEAYNEDLRKKGRLRKWMEPMYPDVRISVLDEIYIAGLQDHLLITYNAATRTWRKHEFQRPAHRIAADSKKDAASKNRWSDTGGNKANAYTTSSMNAGCGQCGKQGAWIDGATKANTDEWIDNHKETSTDAWIDYRKRKTKTDEWMEYHQRKSGSDARFDGAKDVSECSTINNTCKNSDVRAESTQSIGIEGENSDSHDWIAFVRTLETQRTVTRKEQLEAPAQPQLPPQQRAAICKESIVTIPRPSDVPFPCFWPFQ
eukprot:GEMP01022836.1.p1 GENE.GEMP01022836.1~~GEMP01022836.1.p1  ORF type:complete len:267 (+),score=66.39 GEMP01022836.1:367-1167(+)